jgi:hypothetical protein
MSGAADVVIETEERLRPLSIAANLAGWDANVEANDRTEARRVETGVALSDALADAALFTAVEAAREKGGDALVRRQLDLLQNALLPQQAPSALETMLPDTSQR